MSTDGNELADVHETLQRLGDWVADGGSPLTPEMVAAARAMPSLPSLPADVSASLQRAREVDAEVVRDILGIPEDLYAAATARAVPAVMFRPLPAYAVGLPYVPGGNEDQFKDWAWLSRIVRLDPIYLVKERRPARALFWLPARPDWSVLYLTRNLDAIRPADVEGWCMSETGNGHDGLPLVRPQISYEVFSRRPHVFPYHRTMAFVREWAAGACSVPSNTPAVSTPEDCRRVVDLTE